MSTIAPPHTTRDRRVYAHAPLLGGIELLAAEYRQHVFPRHVQDQAVIGIVEAGHVHFSGDRGEDVVLSEGDILFIAPGTVHEARGTFTYRALYLTRSSFDESCATLGVDVPGGAAVFRHPGLYHQLQGAHRRLVSCSLPERDLEVVVQALVDAVLMQRSRSPAMTPRRCVSSPVARVRALLESNPGRRVSIDGMASLARMGRYHFLHEFSRAYGVSPYAYSLNLRLHEAQRRLAAGEPISMTALETGFADQAHLTRHFLRTVGVTPGEYKGAFS